MFAIIQTGGKQYRVKEGDVLIIEKLPQAVGETVAFDQIFLISDEAGEKVQIGAPIVAGAKVEGKVLAQERSKKVSVVKYKPKVRYRRRVGHRQEQTRVKIESIKF